MPESASRGGSPSSRGVSIQPGGFSFQPGGGSPSSWGGSPSSWGGWVLHPAGGILLPAGGGVLHPAGGVLLPVGGSGFSIQLGGVLHPAGGGSPCQTPPVNRMTDRCKNITLAKTSFRPVIICTWSFLLQGEIWQALVGYKVSRVTAVFILT